MSGGVSLGRCFEERVDDVTIPHSSGLGFWAALAPLISGVVQGQQQASGDASDIFTRQQASIAQQRAATERATTGRSIAYLLGGVAILGLGGWAVYRLTKD